MADVENRVKVCDVSDLESGQGMTAEVDGAPVAVFNVDGEFYAIGAECTHMGGPLGEGELEGERVECPWHGAIFDVTSGEVKAMPATEGVPSYDVTVEDGEVFIRLA